MILLPEFAISQAPKRLSLAESRIVLFMATVESPITPDKIEGYYREFVMRPDGYWARQDYLDKIGKQEYWKDGQAQRSIRENALAWFDRNLGAAIRKGLSFRNEDYRRVEGWSTWHLELTQ